NYVGSWLTALLSNIPNTYDGTVSYTDTTNDTATINFTGTQIRYYALTNYNRGIAAVSIDGGAETNVDLYSPTAAGDVLVYTSPVVPPGNHTFKVRNTGTHNPSSSGTRVAIDRFDSIPAPIVTTADDAASGTGQNRINYVGPWSHVAFSTIPGCYN